MKKFLLSGVFIFILLARSIAQVGINTDNSMPDPSAGLDVKFSNKGLLPPRMTLAGLMAISNPTDGLVVYCTNCGISGMGALSMFMAGSWYTLNANCLNPLPPETGTHIASSNQIVWNWNAVLNATGYKWNTTNNYATATDMGTGTTKTETGLTGGTTYTRYIWAYNSCGTSPVTILSQTTLFNVGLNYGGGIVFYVDGTGMHGLISATSDQSTATTWGCYGTFIGGTSTAIGTGQANTTAIVAGCTTLYIAAQICDALELNGYTDWFLPSKNELNQLYLQKTVIGGFANAYYFSSSEIDLNTAWAQYFYGGNTYNILKGATGHVRAVRAF